MKVLILTSKGTSEFEVEPNIETKTLKSLLEEKEGIPIYKQILICGTKVLKDTCTLEEQMGGCKMETLALLLRELGGTLITVNVHLYGGRHVSEKVVTGMKIIDFKNMIQEKYNIPVQGMCYFYMAKILQDTLTMEDYGIKEDSIINMVFRVNGGLV